MPTEIVQFKESDFVEKVELCKGSFAVIYKVLTRDRRQFCLKDFGNIDVDKKRRFDREVTLLAGFTKHPNIVQLKGVIHDPNNRLAFVTELLSMDMSAFCSKLLTHREDGYLTNSEAVLLVFHLFVAVAEALDAMSTKEYVHTDLALPNILLDTEHMIAKVADFGFCRVYSRLDLQTFKSLAPDKKSRTYLFPPAKLRDPSYKYKHSDDCYQYAITLVHGILRCFDIEFDFNNITEGQIKEGGNTFIKSLIDTVKSISSEYIAEDVKQLLIDMLQGCCQNETGWLAKDILNRWETFYQSDYNSTGTTTALSKVKALYSRSIPGDNVDQDAFHEFSTTGNGASNVERESKQGFQASDNFQAEGKGITIGNANIVNIHTTLKDGAEISFGGNPKVNDKMVEPPLPPKLSDPDIQVDRDLINGLSNVHELWGNWRRVGRHLGLSVGQLEEIQRRQTQNNYPSSEAVDMMLHEWIIGRDESPRRVLFDVVVELGLSDAYSCFEK